MAKTAVKQPNRKAKILNSEVIFEGKSFGVRRDELIEPTGVQTIRDVVTHPGSVVVLPVLPDGKIVLVRQYRHATGQYLWELVAGRMERGENPQEGAARELIETHRSVAHRHQRDVVPFEVRRQELGEPRVIIDQ